MKKIIPSILIAITVLQLFAPFSVGWNNRKIEVGKNIVEAYPSLDLQIFPEIINGNSLKIKAKITLGKYDRDNTREGVQVTIINNSTKEKQTKEIDLSGGFMKKLSENFEQEGEVVFDNLNPDASYNIESILRQFDIASFHLDWDSTFVLNLGSLWGMSSDNWETIKSNDSGSEVVIKSYINKLSITQKNGEPITEGGQRVMSESAFLPACSILGENSGTVIGCIAQGLYYLLFKPTSFFFGLAGKALDFTLMYSLDDESYRSNFVVEGWGVVRDFCNMFFIFVLLYIAFGTILNLHGVKTKEMIINVIIIGLLMNFSLFATRLIIDASNILARVFYNQNTIATGVQQKDAEGKLMFDTNDKPIIENELGEFGEIKLSEAIVSKVDPQKLIIEAQKVDSIEIRGTAINEDQTHTGQGITTGSFIIVVLLTTAINIMGMIAFISCGIIFIARVIGLWLAMILVPIAFFSYTVPALKNIKLIGWEHWWQDTLKLAFLAPIFTFFMYIIVGFMNKGLDIVNASNKTGLGFVVAIMVPFVFIMILLMKAKSIAVDMSGEAGQSITNGIKTIGGVALGGAALGGAMLGRNIIGKGLAKASRTEGAMKYSTEKLAFNKKFEEWEKTGGIGPAPKWSDHAKATGVNRWNPITTIGGKLNQKQTEVGIVDHARHEEDSIKKELNLDNIDNANLSGQDIKSMENKYNQNKKSDAENAARKGVDAKGNKILLDGIEGGESAFKSQKRKEISDNILADTDAIKNGDAEIKKGKKVLTKQGEQKLVDELNIKLNVAVKDAAAEKLAKDFEHMRENASKNVNPVTRAFSGANKNSYDVRKLSEMKSDKRESMFTKGSVGLAALIATGVRGGLRGSGFGNSKVKVEGDFMKDLGNTISDSLKSMKVNVDLSHVGEHKSSADAHGGGH